jgi:hypothetical protein
MVTCLTFAKADRVVMLGYKIVNKMSSWSIYTIHDLYSLAKQVR